MIHLWKILQQDLIFHHRDLQRCKRKNDNHFSRSRSYILIQSRWRRRIRWLTQWLLFQRIFQSQDLLRENLLRMNLTATLMILKKRVINYQQREESLSNRTRLSKVSNQSKKASKRTFEKVNLTPTDSQIQSENLSKKMNQVRSLKKFHNHQLENPKKLIYENISIWKTQSLNPLMKRFIKTLIVKTLIPFLKQNNQFQKFQR